MGPVGSKCLCIDSDHCVRLSSSVCLSILCNPLSDSRRHHYSCLVHRTLWASRQRVYDFDFIEDRIVRSSFSPFVFLSVRLTYGICAAVSHPYDRFYYFLQTMVSSCEVCRGMFVRLRALLQSLITWTREWPGVTRSPVNLVWIRFTRRREEGTVRAWKEVKWRGWDWARKRDKEWEIGGIRTGRGRIWIAVGFVKDFKKVPIITGGITEAENCETRRLRCWHEDSLRWRIRSLNQGARNIIGVHLQT